MNRRRSGTVLAWRTRNVRKTRKIETWCADYGLAPVFKALHLGMLYDRERKELSKKIEGLLQSKYDRYHVFTLCKECVRSSKVQGSEENEPPYEII